MGEEEAGAVWPTLLKFIVSLTRCRFATHYVSDKSGLSPPTIAVLAGELDRNDVSFINDLLLGAAGDQSLAIVAFPELRKPLEIASLLVLLASDSRWRLTLPPLKSHPHDDTLVGLWWRTARGDLTSVLGLAPLGEMPVTRRAPHVALVAWTGTHLNPHEPPKATPGEVGLTSCPLPEALQDAARYRAAWDRTRADVSAAQAFPKQAAARPHIAFSLPSEARDLLTPVAIPCDARGRPDPAALASP